MELGSTVTTIWKVCTVMSLIGCFMLLLLLNETDKNASFTSAENAALEYAPLPQPPALSLIDTPLIKLSNFTTSSTLNAGPPPLASEVRSRNNITSSFDHVVEKSKDVNNSNQNDKQNIVTHRHVDYNSRETTKMVHKKCNIFDGRWVYKPETKPSYMVWQCPFIGAELGCQRNGRPDLEYEKWIWEARDCDIPLLNGTDMVERFRNKRVVLVGDSLNRNMWESLSCILYSSIPNASSKAHTQYYGKIKRSVLIAKGDYNFTVEFYWSPFLIEHNKNHESGKRVLVLDKLSPNSETWAGADIMVFNSAHWWGLLDWKKPWDLYEYKGKLIDLPLHIAYKRAMRTWAKWVEKYIDPKKTTLFFRSVSAEHLSRGNHQWCFAQHKPIMDESYKPLFPISLIHGIESVIEEMSKSQIKYLNITKLSEYRIDAHPSIFRYKDWKVRAKKDIHGLSSTADCGHWCLPGIPDTWNRLLYASLYFQTLGDISTSE